MYSFGIFAKGGTVIGVGAERKWKKGYSETREREKGNVNRKTEGKGRIKQAEKKKSRGGGECK